MRVRSLTLVCIRVTLSVCIRATRLLSVGSGSVLVRKNISTELWQIVTAGSVWTVSDLDNRRVVLALIPLKRTLTRSLDVVLHIGVNVPYVLY